MNPPLLTTTARLLAAGAASASLVALAACSTPQAPAPAPAATTEAPTSAPPSPQPTATVTVTPTPEPTPTPTQTPSPSTSPADTNAAMLAAGSTARKAVDGSTVVSIEAERSGWEVEVVTDNGNEQQIRTNPAGTDITSGPTSTRPDNDDRAENRQLAGANVSYREAVRILLREVDGGTLRELNLSEDDGRLIWEADVRVGNQQRNVEIDAETERVLSNQLDD